MNIRTPPLAMNQLPLLAKRIKEAARESIGYTIQNPNALKENSLMWAAVINAGSRTVSAQHSAIKAKDTEQAQAANLQFINTSVREVLGIALNFGVLAFVKNRLRTIITSKMLKPVNSRASRALQKFRNEKQLGGFFKKTGLAIKHWITGAPLPKAQGKQAVTKFEKEIFEKEELTLDFVNTKHPVFKRLQKFVESSKVTKRLDQWINSAPKPRKTDNIVFSMLYTGIPTTLGAVLSIGAAGFWLENTTIQHGTEVKEWVNKKLHGEKAAKTWISTLPQQEVDFLGFYQAAMEKRSNRRN